jgi:hypothetical protein
MLRRVNAMEPDATAQNDELISARQKRRCGKRHSDHCRKGDRKSLHDFLLSLAARRGQSVGRWLLGEVSLEIFIHPPPSRVKETAVRRR